MAERRMFSKKITESDSFTALPPSTQNLYFHFSMNSDDDGFVNNARSVQRQIGAKNRDIELLIANGYIMAFDSGVFLITHWRINNSIRSDRHTSTIYTSEFSQIYVDKSGAYTKDMNGATPAQTAVAASSKSADALPTSRIPVERQIMGYNCGFSDVKQNF